MMPFSPKLLALTSALAVISVHSDVEQFDCSGRAGPLQVIGVGNAYEVRELFYVSQTSEHYDTLFSVSKTKTKPPFHALNGCGINPVDQKAYCNVRIDSNAYLSRFDKDNFEFVAKLPAWSWSATFSTDGTFYMYSHRDRKFYMFSNVGVLPGFASQHDEMLTDFRDHVGFNYHVGCYDYEAGADLVAVEKDFDGSGQHTWLVTLRRQILVLIRIVPPFDLVCKELPVPTGAYPNAEHTNFGAAFTFANRIYFGANSGSGVYEVSNISWMNGTVKVERVGPSAPSNNNDGMNCMNSLVAPWPTAQVPAKLPSLPLAVI